ncbi:MAG: DUF3857 and transglutaminase domain-containing protein [candidate division Zixibacteria bacterium]|nr:DUF3857 and transglutaminase domain-containing protein [candidate division Zixibacteria bacterium]
MTDHRPVQGCFLKTALFVLIMINFFSLIPNSLHAWERIDFKNAPTQDMFPESDAVAIKNEGQMEIKKNGEALFTQHGIIKIFSDTDQRYSRQSLPFNNSVKIISIKARTINEGGEEFVLNKNQIAEKSMFSEYVLYSDAKVKEFNFPRVQKNSIVEYEYKFLLKSLFFWHDWFFQDEIPVIYSKYILKIPKDFGFKSKVVNDKIEPQIKFGDDNKKLIFIWEAKDKKALKKETLMPPLSDVASRLVFSPSTFKMEDKIYPSKTWGDVARWYSELFSGSIIADERTKDLASTLTSNLSSKRRKLKAIYEWMQEHIRYVSVAIGTGAFKPHNCQEVLDYKYGDCKDMSSFLIALLKAIGIEAFPTLISTKGDRRVLEDMPKPRQFDHVMVVAPLDGEYIWLDPACRNCKFGQPPFEDQGATALVVKKDQGELITSPESSFDQNLSQTFWEIKLNPDRSVTGKVMIKAEGQEDLAFKNSLLELKPTKRKEALLDFVSFWFIDVDLNRYEFKNLEEKDSSICMKGDFTAKKFGTETGGKLFLPINFTIQRNISQAFPKKDRNFPVLFDYEFSTIDEVSIQIPNEFEIEFLPSNTLLEENFGLFESSYEIIDNRIYHKRIFERKEIFVPVEEYERLKEFYDRVAKEDNQNVILKIPPGRD